MTEKAEQAPETPNKTRLLSSGLLVSSMTMLSRILGLVRDIVLAVVLGGMASGGQASAFYVAFKVPQFLRRLFAEGAFSQAFVPVLGEYQQTTNRQQVQALIDRVAGGLSIILVVVVVLVIMGSPVVTYMVAPGFAGEAEKFALTESLIRITFPYLLFISLAGFLGAILNANNRFAAPAFTPVLLNICLIAAGLYFVRFTESVAMALAYGVLLAGVIQLLFLFPFVYRLGFLPKPKIDFSHPGVKKILRLMLPALLGVSVSQINLVFDTILASLLPEGSIPWLYYSQRLSDLPLGVFAIAISTVILPGLSRAAVSKDTQNFAPTLDWAVRFVLMISIPAVLALWVLATPILSTLFFHGAVMTEQDIQMMRLSLIAYALGLPFFMLIKVLVPGYYARQDMKTPVKIGIKAMLANMLLNIVFVVPMHLYLGWGHMGLALATAVSAMLNVYWLWKGLLNENVYRVQQGFFKQCLIFLVAGGLMALVLAAIYQYLPAWFDYGVWQRVAYLLTAVALGGLVYFAVLFLAGIRLHHFRQKI